MGAAPMKNLLLLVLAGLFVFLVVKLTRPSDVPPGDAGPLRAPAATEPAERAPADLDGPSTEASATPSSDRVALDVEPTHAAPPAPVTAEQGALDLAVVDLETGAPVPGAIGFQFRAVAGTSPTHIARLVDDVVYNGLEGLRAPLASAIRLEADAQGVLHPHAWTGSWMLLALEPGAALEGGLPAPDARRGFAFAGSATVELATPRDFTVTVRDAQGAPVPRVFVVNEQYPTSRRWSGRETDANGRVAWHEATTLLRPVARDFAAQGGQQPGFAFNVPGGAEPVAVDLAAPRDLTLTITGATLELQFLGVDGEPWKPAVPVLNAWLVAPHAAAADPPDDWGVVRADIDADGRAIVHGIPAGRRVHIEVNQSWNGTQAFEDFDTAPVPREGLQLVIRAKAPEAADIQVRLLLPDGSPAAKRRFDVWTAFENAAGGGSLALESVEGDGEGVVRLQFRANDKALAPGATLGFEFLSTEAAPLDLAGDPTRLHIALVPLEGPSAPPWQLGPVRLEELAPFVSGRVVDSNGAPVEAPELRLFARQGAERHWIEGSLERGVSDGAGHFAFFGHADDPGAWEWTVEANDAFENQSGPVPFRPGERDVEVVLRADTQLEVSFVPEHRALSSGLTVRVQPVDPALRLAFEPRSNTGRSGIRGRWWKASFPTSGRIVWRKLGSAPLEVELLDGSDVLARWDDVALEAGTLVRDPRLVDLRLDRWFELVPFLVLDNAGHPIEGAQIRHLDGDWCRYLDGILMLRELPQDVVVTAPGHVGQTVAAASGRVVLSDSIQVTLALPHAVAAAKKAEVALRWKAGERWLDGPWTALVGERVDLSVPGTGEHRVVVRVPWGADGPKTLREFDLTPQLELDPGDGGRAFDVTFPPELAAKLE